MTEKPPTIRLDLKRLALVQTLALILLSSVVSAIGGVQLGASFAVGMGLMGANLLLLAWFWGRIVAKKSFALTSGIIVVKYTVLLGAIFFLTREAWFHALGAGLGMAAFIVSALIQAGTSKWE